MTLRLQLRPGILPSLPRHGLRGSARALAPSSEGPASRRLSSSASRSKPRLVILGSGWGGYEVLRGVNKKNWSECVYQISTFGRGSFYHLDVTVVSPSNYFNFTPLLASCAVGTLEFRAAIEPVRPSDLRHTFVLLITIR